MARVKKIIQKDNEKWDYYYDAMEYLNEGDTKTAKLLLQKAIKLDKDFVAAYMGLTSAFREEKNEQQIRKYTKLAYEKTKKAFPKWPKEMIWGVIDNRQYLRAICDKAILFHKEGNAKQAEKLYRLLLQLNPNDNQGIRYLLAALFARLKPEVVDELTEEGNQLQNWSKLEKLLEEQNAQYHFWTNYET